MSAGNITLQESILGSIRKLLGMDDSYKAFDTDLILHINTVFSNLTQMGVGPEDGFEITGDTETWDSYTPRNPNARIGQIKTYVYFKVRIAFDPPASSVLMESLNNLAKELEVRLYTEEGGY